MAVVVLFALTGASKPPAPSPIFREDLHPFGYPAKLEHQSLIDYTDLAFLSDDLILVSVIEYDLRSRRLRSGYSPYDDKTTSKLLLFDIARKKLVRTADLLVLKSEKSVHATHDGRFVVCSGSKIQICSSNLECDAPVAIPGNGPIFVSPRGTRILAGGYGDGIGQSEQELLDGDSLKVLGHFPWGQAAMPGDTAVLATRGKELYLLRDDAPDKLLKFPGGGYVLNAQFLSDDTFATFEGLQTLVAVDLDNTIKYRIPILMHYSGTDIVPAASGSRFCIHQEAYRTLGSKLSVEDEHKTRTVDIYRIFDTHSGNELFHLEWDPRPYLSLPFVAPALSPNGHRLAVMHSGYLEIYDLP